MSSRRYGVIEFYRPNGVVQNNFRFADRQHRSRAQMYSNTSSIVHVAHSTHPGHGASARAAGGTFASRTAADFEAWPEPSTAVESNIRKASLRVTTGGRHHLRAFALSRSWLGPIDDEVLARAARPGRTCRVEQQLSSVEQIGRSRLLVQLREHAHGQCQRKMV